MPMSRSVRPTPRPQEPFDPEPILAYLRTFLIAARKGQGLTQQALGKRVHLSTTSISAIELGSDRRADITVRQLLLILHAVQAPRNLALPADPEHPLSELFLVLLRQPPQVQVACQRFAHALTTGSEPSLPAPAGERNGALA